MSADLRKRLRERVALCGTFIKTPQYQNVEIAGFAELDFVVLDAEHAPFSAAQIDQCLLACRAANVAGIVRIPDATAPSVLQVLDMGASGILVPHVTGVEKARQIVAMTRYRDGVRGFSNSPRAGGYGTLGMAEHIALHDARVSVLCQIEDREGVEQVEAIAAVEGIDCLFIGRADLALSYGVFDVNHDLVEKAVERTAAAGRDAGVAVGIFISDTTPIKRYAALGISLFLIGSDQSILRAGCKQIQSSVHALP